VGGVVLGWGGGGGWGLVGGCEGGGGWGVLGATLTGSPPDGFVGHSLKKKATETKSRPREPWNQ